MKELVISITLFRILAAPLVFIAAVFFEGYWLSFWLFNLAAFTDYLDGKLARYFKVESLLGRILDPIADKLLLLFAIISIIIITRDIYVALIGVLLLGREFWISALREFSSLINISHLTAVTFLAKTKTAFQFIAISMYYFGFAMDYALLIFLANFVLFIAALLALQTAINYTVNFFKHQRNLLKVDINRKNL